MKSIIFTLALFSCKSLKKSGYINKNVLYFLGNCFIEEFKTMKKLLIFLFLFSCGESEKASETKKEIVNNENVDYSLETFQEFPDLTDYIDSKYSAFNDHFREPLANIDNLVLNKISHIKQLTFEIQKLHTDLSDYEKAYENIVILNNEFVQPHIHKLDFSYKEKIYNSYSYYKNSETSNNIVSFVVPGSGVNQSTDIFYNTNNNYQMNIDDITKQYSDTFIFIKPLEDILAVHNGKQKISNYSYVNYLLNNGSSYSATYLLQAIAHVKYIQTVYEKTYVFGLSQGGYAATFVSIMTRPNKSFIASGYSELLHHPHLAAQNQVIFPGSEKILNINTLNSYLKTCNCEMFFSYGQQESNVYGYEYGHKHTENLLNHLNNIDFYYHPKGHEYYQQNILDSMFREFQ